MATLLSSLETQARFHLNESSASFWSSAELVNHLNSGIRDLWRPIVDLKAEHFLTVDDTNVTLAANTASLSGLPEDIHKVYLIAPRDVTSSGSNANLWFDPIDFNDKTFQSAQTQPNVDPSNTFIYYAITGQGAPTDSDDSNMTIYVAPKVTAAVNIRFVYVPTLALRSTSEYNPIPGESDNALIAWTVAFARAKEREDRMPDPGWLQVYKTEKAALLQSLGLRQLQEPTFVDGLFSELW